MRTFILLFLVVLSAGAYGQNTLPDTLQLETKTGQKIILIGKDINSFKALKVDSLIGRALYEVKDSLNVLVLTKQDTLKAPDRKKWKLFILLPHIGAGLIRDKLSPNMGLSIDFAPQRKDYLKEFGMYTFINLALNVNYLFDKDALGNHTYANVFLEASLGNRINNKKTQKAHFDEFSFGAGYLVRNSGNYFQNNTFKLFGAIVPSHSYLKIKPELYITDDFKQVFPGVSVGVRFY